MEGIVCRHLYSRHSLQILQQLPGGLDHAEVAYEQAVKGWHLVEFVIVGHQAAAQVAVTGIQFVVSEGEAHFLGLLTNSR